VIDIFVIGMPAAAISWLGAVWLGWQTVRRPQSAPPEVDPLILAWVGWYLQSLLVLTCGWLGLLGPAPLVSILVLPAGAAVLDRRFLRSWLPLAMRPYLRGWQVLGWWGGGFITLIVIWLGLMLSLPTFHYDCLTYGYGRPLHWLLEGRITPPGLDVFAYTSVPQRMQTMLAFGTVGEPLATVAPLGFVLAAALLAVRTVRYRKATSDIAAFTAGALIMLTPTVWDLLALRKEDLAVLHGAAALVLLAVAAPDDRIPSVRRIVVLGLVSAATFAAKPLVTVGVVAAAVMLALHPSIGRCSSRSWWGSVAGTSAVAVLALAPLMAHTWIGAGHPLAAGAPHLGRAPLATARWHKIFDDAYPVRGVALAELPAEIVSEVARFFDPSHWNFGDFLGLAVLVGAPLVLFLRRAPSAERWLVAAGLLGWYLTFHRPRFVLVLVPAVATAVATLCDRWGLRRTLPVAVALVAGLNLIIWFETPTGAIFRAGVLSRPNRTDFVPASVTVLETANRQLDASEHRILFVGESRVFPCRIPFDYWNPNFRHPFEMLVRGVPPETLWEKHIRNRGITHVVYSPQVARTYMELSPRLFAQLEIWLARRGRVIARGQDADATTVLLELVESEGNNPERLSSPLPPVRPGGEPSR